MNKLPKIFANPINKKIDNSLDYIKINNENKKTLSNFEIKDKIDKIFKSKNYIYKIDVEIKLINGDINCTLIGKTNNSLITIDNKLININDILDIKIKNS